MAFNVHGNFAGSPTGAFIKANKQLVWSGQNLNQDFDPNGQWYSIVSDSRFQGGKACRMLYKAGRYGMNDQSYQWQVSSPNCAVGVEYDWLFEDGFSWATSGGPPNMTLKVGPCIQWGNIGGDNSQRGTRCMFWAYGNGSQYMPVGPKWWASVQDQASGGQLLPTMYGPKIETNRVYHLKIEMRGGDASHAYAKFWVDGALLNEVSGKAMKHSNTDHCYFDYAFFAGGGDKWFAPAHDSYARHGNVRCYSVGAVDQPPVELPPGEQPPVDGGGQPPVESVPTARFNLGMGEVKVFSARFHDDQTYPPAEVAPGGAVKWSLNPNIVQWGAGLDPNYKDIQVKGNKVGSATLIATDPGSGAETKPVTVEVTEAPHTVKATTGVCTVEPLPAEVRTHEEEFSDEPPEVE